MHTQNDRFYALDGLRASMMLLGLVLHSFNSYGVPSPGVWPYQDPMISPIADFVSWFIHSFRMPIFFVMAGFFSGLLYEKRGGGGLLRNRALRIALPFAVGLMLIWPLVVSGIAFANLSKSAGIGDAFSDFQFGRSLFPENTLHLWFLYFLLFFYPCALLLAGAYKKLPDVFQVNLIEAFRFLLKRPLARLVVLTLITTAILANVNGYLITSLSFQPNLWIMLTYFVFFSFGWLLFYQNDLLPLFSKYAIAQLAVALIVLGIFQIWILPSLADISHRVIARSITTALTAWLFFFSFTGLFLRFLDRPSAKIRYVVDASYWMYLIHLPLCLWIPGLLAELVMPGLVKGIIVLALVALITLLSYDLMVRSTIIGKVLHGRRYPRRLAVK